MTELVILGTANSIPTADHENTHMALVCQSGVILVDCVGTPAVRLPQAGINLDDIHDMILTHFHPDHVSAVPLLLMNMWLMGRQKPLRIYGLHHCLKRIEDTMSFYRWENWPDFFPVSFHRLPEEERSLVLENDEVRVTSTPVRHLVPTIGLRFDHVGSDRAIAYSCDTEPCDSVVAMAAGADLLIHEASGATVGHSSAAQAAEIARRAEVGRLMLIHYPCYPHVQAGLVEAAAQAYQGPTSLATDLMRIPLNSES